uniref:gelsolin, cytoplasmic-like n=1 Tax=Styela clava TaxID=7725 RepID=UPI00193A0171|nr:gelsolin, cytoplasmic-like [Styela clava]
MGTSEEIQKAGKAPGLQIWRIEKFEMVPVPAKDYGYFFKGDSYIVLSTKELKSGKFEWHIHYWQGVDSTQDETGSVAILAVKVDDHLGGGPVQHREVQGYESAMFSGYFRPAIHYREGGVETGFTHAETNKVEDVNMLLRVKGKRPVRTEEVPMKWKSLTEGDSYIFDQGEEIYIWSGPASNPFERNKAINVANAIKDERQGRANVYKLESNEISKLKKFFDEPYPGSIAASTSDEEVNTDDSVKLFQISDDSGKIAITLVSDQPPFLQSQLDGGDTYVVTNARTNHVYVWKGKGSSAKERMSAGTLGKDFLKKVGMSDRAGLTTMAQYGETSAFKNMFKDWKNSNDQQGLGKTWSINKIAKVEKENFDASTLHNNPAIAAETQLVDDGSGQCTIWRVEGFRRALVDSKTHGQFYGGDCYIVKYTPRTSRNHILYYWRGNKATRDEVTALPRLTIQTHEKECNNNATQVRVVQGKEPDHMMMMFGGNPLIVHAGGTSRAGGQTKPADTRLFHIKSFYGGFCRAVEVASEASSLNSNDAFLLITPGASYVWVGSGAVDKEVKGCMDTARILKVPTPQKFEEGSEPGDFWQKLGGQGEYAKDCREEDDRREPVLFECSNATGNFKVEVCASPWIQDDLNPDNVMMLDAWTMVYIWIGVTSNEEERIGALKSVTQYLKTDPSDRDETTPVAQVQQGNEPLTFKGFFQGWDDGKWSN